jgi:hypothetical protein
MRILLISFAHYRLSHPTSSIPMHPTGTDWRLNRWGASLNLARYGEHGLRPHQLETRGL